MVRLIPTLMTLAITLSAAQVFALPDHYVDITLETHDACGLIIKEGDKIREYPASDNGIIIEGVSSGTLIGSDCAPGEFLEFDTSKDTYIVDTIALSSFLSYTSNSWHREAMSIDEAHEYTKGAGVRIAVINPYFDPNHLEFKNNQITAINYDGSPYVDPTVCRDPEGNVVPGCTRHDDLIHHETATLGLIGADYFGIAPEAELTFIQGNTYGMVVGKWPEEHIQAIIYAIDQNYDLISISYGGQEFSQEDYDRLKPAFDKALEQGTYIFKSAGNGANDEDTEIDSNDTLAILAREYPNVFLVEASDSDGQWAYFSQRGEVRAPGMDVILPTKAATTELGTRFIGKIHNLDTGVVTETEKVWTVEDMMQEGYGVGSGTSYSAPLAAGTLALMFSVNPELKYHPELVEEILVSSQEDNSGFGINAYSALLMAMNTDLN